MERVPEATNPTTIVVVVTVFFFGFYLYGLDLILSKFNRNFGNRILTRDQLNEKNN